MSGMADKTDLRLRASAGTLLVWLFILLVLAFLYAPLLPPVLQSFRDTASADIFAHYRGIWKDPLLVGGIHNTLVVGLVVAAVTPLVALAVAQALRVWRSPRVILALVLMPLFVPGVSMGVATAIFFRVLGIEPSLTTIMVVQIVWALPFATLIIMTVMASFETSYLEAAHMLGAKPVQAFLEIELPHVRSGLMGAAAFSLILSFNETIRTSIVQGGQNTVQTYLWSQYQQVGLSPVLHALMALLIAVTLALMVFIIVIGQHTKGRRHSSESS